MVYNISICIIILITVLAMLFSVFPVCVKRGRKKIKICWYLLIFSFAIFSYYAEPSVSDDLFRHYADIDNIRRGVFSLDYSALFVWQFFEWLVSKTNHNGWLPFFTIILIGFFIQQIQDEWFVEHSFSVRGSLLGYLSALAGLGIFSIVSGIRCTLVSAMLIYAYLSFYEKRRKKFYIISIIGCMIHTVGVLYIVLILIHNLIIVSKNRTKTVYRIVLTLVSLRILILLNVVEALFGYLPGKYGDLLLFKWNSYYGVKFENRTTGGIGAVLLFLLFAVYLFCILYLYTKKISFDSLIVSVIFIVVLGSGIDIFYDRMAMACGLLGMPLLLEMSNILKGIRKMFFLWTTYLIFGIEILYSTYSMCCHISFNGNYYREFFRMLLE